MKFKEYLNETFVDIKDISTDEEILRLAVEAELDAINLYQVLSRKTKNREIKDLLLDLAFEEKVHVKELEAFIEYIDEEDEDAEFSAYEEMEDEDM
jgi:rubrerythrin